MKLREIYELAIKMGGKEHAGTGGADEIERVLAAARKEYEKLEEGGEREFFDTETLENPFHDTRILVGEGEEEIGTALVGGIDMETPEILLADRLR